MLLKTAKILTQKIIKILQFKALQKFITDDKIIFWKLVIQQNFIFRPKNLKLK